MREEKKMNCKICGAELETEDEEEGVCEDCRGDLREIARL